MPTYDEVRSAWEWNVPERYNIAADVCDRHPRDKLAMVWERFDGARRDATWGELQDLANQAAHVLREHGVERGDRVAVVLPPTPETAAIFFGTWKLGAILLSMSVLYGDDGIRHRLEDSEPRVLVTDEANAGRFTEWGGEVLTIERLLDGAPTDPISTDTAADVCDKHPRDKPAMVHERFDGEVREVAWGELQDLSAQAAHDLPRARLGQVGGPDDALGPRELAYALGHVLTDLALQLL